MNRLYLMPKILILAFIYLYFTKTFTLLNILLSLLASIVVVILLQVLAVTIKGKYYLWRLNKGKKINKVKIYSYINKIITTVNYILGLRIKVYNYEYFDPNKHYLITPNHQSNNDVLILLEVIKSPVVYVAKIAISKLIIVKDWMKLIGSLYLDKNDMRGQIKIMQQVQEKLNNQETVIIFPEGKRSFTSEMNEFRPGTFKVATKTKVDILPITINNAYIQRRNFPWRKTEISVYFHKPIPYNVYKDMTTPEIAKMVRDIVETKVI